MPLVFLCSVLIIITSLLSLSGAAFQISPHRRKISRLTTSMSSTPTTQQHQHHPQQGDGKFHFAVDRGGTFTDVHCKLPNGTELVSKLLSVDPANYDDAPTEGIRRILDEHDPTGKKYPRGQVVDTSLIGSIRMGTTVATNALLEREGERMGLVITKGFGDLLKIGDQTRSDM